MPFSLSSLFPTLRLEPSIVIDNRWRYSILFLYRISIRLYFFTVDFWSWLYSQLTP